MFYFCALFTNIRKDKQLVLESFSRCKYLFEAFRPFFMD